MNAPVRSLATTTLHDQEAELAQLSARIEAATHRQLTLIRSLDDAGVWADQGAKSCAAWLAWRIELSSGAARERVRVARTLGDLPCVDGAMQRGRLSFSKVRALTRVATPSNEADLLRVACVSTAAQLERICRGLRQVSANDNEGETLPPEREVTLRSAGDGTTRLSAKLLPDEAARVMEALVAVCAQLREERGADPAPGLADALVHLAERYAVDPQVEAQEVTPAVSAEIAPAASKNTPYLPSETPLAAVPAEMSPAASPKAPAEMPEVASASLAAVPAGISPTHAAASAQMCLSPVPAEMRATTLSSNTNVPAEMRATTLPSNTSVPAESHLLPGVGSRTPAAVPETSDVPEGTPNQPERVRKSRRRHTPAELVIHLERDFLGDVGAILDDGTRVSPETFRRVACDCAIRCTSSTHDVVEDTDTIDVGRRTRAISPALRRALDRRDQGCRFPGCQCTRYVQAHHIEHWAHGGETNLDNLLTLCTFHHQLLHEGGWSVARVREEGVRDVQGDRIAFQHRFEFRDRRGRVHAPRPRAVPLARPLAALRETTGPLPTDTDPRANLGWIGDRPDYPWVVAVLSPLVTRPAAG